MEKQNIRAQDAEYIITRAFYIFSEAQKRGKEAPDLYDDVTKFFIKTAEHGSWGYVDTKALVIATAHYARLAEYLNSYSGAFYKQFEMFLEKE